MSLIDDPGTIRLVATKLNRQVGNQRSDVPPYYANNAASQCEAVQQGTRRHQVSRMTVADHEGAGHNALPIYTRSDEQALVSLIYCSCHFIINLSAYHS